MTSEGGNRFFIVGAMRSGTTYTSTVLDEHPQICMAKPILPEPKFFLKDHEFREGRDFYRSRYFPDCGGAVVFGEKTVHYAEREEAARRIREWFPECKILFVLRNPVYRALSNYFFSVRNGLESRSLDEVFIKKIQAPPYDSAVHFISPYNYLHRGIYLTAISLYERYFDRKNIRVIISEQFTGSLEGVQQLYRFLGVDATFVPPSLEEVIFSINVNHNGIDQVIIETLKEFYREPVLMLERHLGIRTGW